MNTPPITITAPDLERLEQCLESRTARELPGIDMLYEELMRADIVDASEIASDIVTMNSTVVFVDEQSEQQYELTLVYPDQAGKSGTVSVLAPVGSALLGLAVGQAIEWQIPGGRQLRLRVNAVRYQPESTIDYKKKRSSTRRSSSSRRTREYAMDSMYDKLDLRLMATFPASDAVAQY